MKILISFDCLEPGIRGRCLSWESDMRTLIMYWSMMFVSSSRKGIQNLSLDFMMLRWIASEKERMQIKNELMNEH